MSKRSTLMVVGSCNKLRSPAERNETTSLVCPHCGLVLKGEMATLPGSYTNATLTCQHCAKKAEVRFDNASETWYYAVASVCRVTHRWVENGRRYHRHEYLSYIPDDSTLEITILK